MSSEKIKRYELCEDVEVQTEESGYIIFQRGELDLVCKSKDVEILESQLSYITEERDRAMEVLDMSKFRMEQCHKNHYAMVMDKLLEEGILEISSFLSSHTKEKEEK